MRKRWRGLTKQMVQKNWSHNQTISSMNIASMYFVQKCTPNLCCFITGMVEWCRMSLIWHVKKLAWICIPSGPHVYYNLFIFYNYALQRLFSGSLVNSFRSCPGCAEAVEGYLIIYKIVSLVLPMSSQ